MARAAVVRGRAVVASAEVAAAKAMVTVARAARATRVAEKGVEEKVAATTSVERAGVGGSLELRLNRAGTLMRLTVVPAQLAPAP